MKRSFVSAPLADLDFQTRLTCKELILVDEKFANTPWAPSEYQHPGIDNAILEVPVIDQIHHILCMRETAKAYCVEIKL